MDSQMEQVCTPAGSQGTTQVARQPALQLQRTLVRGNHVHAAMGSRTMHCFNDEVVQVGKQHA